MSIHGNVKRVTTHTLQKMKENGEKISMLTAYDYSFARIFDEAGVDVLLIGDSAANVVSGFETTLPMTLNQMIIMADSVVRAAKRSFVICDLPFGSYQGNSKEALNSSIRIMKESGAHAVKLEGGKEVCDAISRVVSAGIPVMAHLGLTPQSINKFGTYAVRAKDEAEAEELIQNAIAVQEAGAFALVLEKIPAALGEKVAKTLTIPVIGIGAGGGVDGQVLVMHDMLGITKDFSPRFLRRYLDLYEEIKNATGHYIADVRSGDFPNNQEQY